MMLAKDREKSVLCNLAQNSSLKIRPGLLLYFYDDEWISIQLKSYNQRLYQRIGRMEGRTLQEVKVGFMKLGSTKQQREIVKKIILERISIDEREKGHVH